MAFAPHLATLVIATLAIGWLMTVAGLQKNALELKKRRRVCPSCGRPTRVKHTILESGARAIECRHCGEPYERVRKTEAQ